MRFNLIDRVHAWEPGKRLTASKLLTSGEEYLADHFPTFPVMPGVLMLQSVVEASSWLWRISTDFQHTIIVLRETRNVKYGTFMQPGFTLEISTELVRADEGLATFKCKGGVQGGGTTVQAQVVLSAYNVENRGSATFGEKTDAELRRHWQDRWLWLTDRLANQA